MTEFTTRPLLWDDLKWLRDLRNANRRQFFCTDEITDEGQLYWWVNHTPGEEHWVIDVEDKHAGYFAFVHPNPQLPVFKTEPLRGHVHYLNSLLLEPAYRGQGLMQAAIRTRMSQDISYCGYVRWGNQPSLRTCEAVGLKQMGMFTNDYGTMHVLWRG